MSRVSTVLMGSMVLGIVASAAGCRVSAESKTRFTENNIAIADTQDWVGQPILIDIPAAGVVINGGVNVDTSSVATDTKIAANARVVAYAFDEDKADAQLTINDVKAGFVITNTPTLITISCPHGQTRGGSNSGESGCELTNIVVPQGTVDRPLDLEIRTGNGDLKINGLTGKFKRLAANANGAACDIDATVGPSSGSIGAAISLVSEQSGDITLRVPGDFAADSVALIADPGASSLGPYASEITATDGTVGRGVRGSGFASIKLTSKPFAGSSGKLFLQ